MTVLLPGTSALLAAHAAELPQKDGLCGAFWGLLALRSAGTAPRPEARRQAPLDQDSVAEAAGSTLSPATSGGPRPPGEQAREDFRLVLPRAPDSDRAGTAAGGLARAIERLSRGAVSVVPAAGAWDAERLLGLVDGLCGWSSRVTLIANIRVGCLWTARASAAQLAGYLESGEHAGGPEAEWDGGHFVALLGLVRGRRGALVVVADSYASQGLAGVHLQPAERMAAALAREGMAPGGALLAVAPEQRTGARAAVQAAGLTPALWDNGSIDRAASAGAALRHRGRARSV